MSGTSAASRRISCLGLDGTCRNCAILFEKKLKMINIIIITTILDLNGIEVSNTNKKTNIYSILSLTFFFFSRLTGEALSPWMISPYWGRAVNLKHERSTFLSPVLLGVCLGVCFNVPSTHFASEVCPEHKHPQPAAYRWTCKNRSTLTKRKKRHTCLYLLHTCTFVLMWRLPLTYCTGT